MKKLLLTIAAAVGIVASTHAGNAYSFDESFLNNCTYVCLSNNMTASFAGPYYAAPVTIPLTPMVTYGTNNFIWYYDYKVGTNVQAGVTTNAITGNLQQGPFCDVPIFADANGCPNTNVSIYVTIGVNSNYPPVSVTSPVNSNLVWTNPMAFFYQNAGITTPAPGTNTISLVFAPVSDTRAGMADGSPGRQWTWLVAVPGNTLPLTVSVNPPPSLVQGTTKLRLYSYTISTNSAAANGFGVVIDALGMRGYEGAGPQN